MVVAPPTLVVPPVELLPLALAVNAPPVSFAGFLLAEQANTAVAVAMLTLISNFEDTKPLLNSERLRRMDKFMIVFSLLA